MSDGNQLDLYAHPALAALETALVRIFGWRAQEQDGQPPAPGAVKTEQAAVLGLWRDLGDPRAQGVYLDARTRYEARSGRCAGSGALQVFCECARHQTPGEEETP